MFWLYLVVYPTLSQLTLLWLGGRGRADEVSLLDPDNTDLTESFGRYEMVTG
jgi:hypothetical protein